MAVAIKATSTTISPPSHTAGDLLIAFTWGSGTASSSNVNAGWTYLNGASTIWSYEAFQVAYCIATDSNTTQAFPSSFGTDRVFAISGAKASAPIAASATNTATASPVTISSISVPGGTTLGGSAVFDGSGDKLTVADNSAFNLPGDFTIEFWTAPRPNSDYNHIINKYAPNFAWAINVMESSKKVQFMHTVGGAVYDIGTYDYGKWAHYAVSRSGSTIKTFKNGSLTATNTNSTDFSCASTDLHIGTNNDGQWYNGYLSNVRIVKGTALYTSAFTAPTAPLTAVDGTSLLTCQSSSGITDSSSNNFTITKGGDATQSSKSPFNTTGSGLRLTLLCGTGGGGNPFNNPSRDEGDNFTRLVDTGYAIFYTGGMGDLKLTADPGIWNLRWITLSVEPAVESGFFAMF